MAVLTSKLSSPNISGRANPNTRNSEIGNSMRRSFTGNPFANKPSIVPNPRGINPNTPANSPAENLRRNSNEEDKENSKAAKVRSPMGPKGTKNFMSPTISAASKITASPRKRILEERNEAVRGSVSFSELKIPSFESEPKKEEEEEELEEEALTEPSDSMPEKSSVSEEVEFGNLGPNFKISPPSVPVIAPLDSDPQAVVAPYDPKTNYLSPRPRFLHYKPNPRVELYLNRARDGQKRLEESFDSRVSSDTEEEELESNVSSGEEMKSEEPCEEEEELVVSEPSPNDERPLVEMAKKPRSVCRSKLAVLLVVVSIVCISITVMNSPVVDHSFFDGSSNFFADFDHEEVLEFAKTRLRGLAQKLGIWYENTVSFVSDIYLGGSQSIEPADYFNSTEALNDMNGWVFAPTINIEVTDISVEFDDEEFDIEKVFEVLKADLGESGNGLSISEVVIPKVDEVEHEFQNEVDTTSFGAAVESDNGVTVGEFGADSAQISQPNEVEHEVSEAREIPYEVFGSEIESDNEPPEPDTSLSKENGKISEVDFRADEIQDQNSVLNVVGLASLSEEDGKFSEADFRADETRDHDSALDVVGSASLSDEDGKISEVESQDHNSVLNVLGLALFAVFAAIASTAFAIAEKDNNSSPSDAKNSVEDQDLVTKKLDLSPATRNTVEVKHSTWNFSGDYCPSEMSSYEINNNKEAMTNGLNEAQSYERNHKKKNQRRESMDSSMGSPSYGSFTTYEKIPVKYGYGEEEIITPVRRSSRLRTQVTSPL